MPESSRQPGSLLALLGLYATLLYTKANYETWKQGISSDERLVINVGLGAIVGIVAVMMASPGWSCALLLLPIIILAAVSDPSSMEKLHGLAAFIVLSQGLAASLFQPTLLLSILASLSVLFIQFMDMNIQTVIKTAISGVILQATILIGLPGSFSLGEASILSQVVTMTKYFWAANGQGNWTVLQQLGYMSWLSTAMSVMLTVSLATALPLARHPIVMLISLLASGYGISHMMQWKISDFASIISNLTEDTGAPIVVAIWIVGIICALLCSWLFSTFEVGKTEEEQGQLQLFRKSYHLLALLILLPSGLYHLQLTQFFVAVALCAFIASEAIRILMPKTFLGEFLNEFITYFSTEDEVKGSAIIPHFFLLLGCAIPIFISDTANSIHAYSGVFALCITDASAAITGALFGEHKWPRSKKTIEGTLIAFVVTYIFMSFISDLVTFEQQVPELPSILTFSVALPIWEALSDQNDNLTLPVVALAVSSLVF